jgi:hypothetical protein
MLLILTALNKVINAQEIVTDRPDQTESSTTVPGKSFQMGMYVETFGEYSDFTEIISKIDSGFTYLIKENLQLDFSLGLGLNQKMNYFSLGFSWNISCNHHKNK